MQERIARFITNCLEGAQPESAALLAGYPEKGAAATARRLLKRADVKEALGRGIFDQEGDACGEGAVTVDWVVREARRTYDAAHEAGSLSTAVSCLNLIGKHLESKAALETGEKPVSEVVIVTGIEKAPNSDADA